MVEWNKNCIKIKEGKTPAGVPWFEVDGYLPQRDTEGKLERVKRKRFRDKQEALDYQKNIQDEGRRFMGEGQVRKTRLTEDQENDAYHAYGLLEERFSDAPFKPSLVDVVTFYSRNFKEIESKTVNEAVAHYLDSQSLKDATVIYRNRVISQMNHFQTAYDSRFVYTLSRDDLRDFIYRTPDLTNYAYLNNFSAVNAFMNHCVDERWIASNPLIPKKDKPKAVREKPHVLTIEEVETLLRNAELVHDGIMVPFFAIAIFCGVRVEETNRMLWADVKINNTYQGEARPKLLVTGKGDRDRSVDMPMIAKEWIEPYYQTSGNLRPTNWRKLYDLIRAMSGFRMAKVRIDPSDYKLYAKELKGCSNKSRKEWKKNNMRHTGITYRVIDQGGDKAGVGYWAGNKPEVIDKHYMAVRNAGDETTKDEFYAIKPTPPKKLAKLRKG